MAPSVASASAVAAVMAAVPLAAAAAGGLRGAEAQDFAGRGMCGIATGMINANDEGMASFCELGLDFFWNWGFEPPPTVGRSACASDLYIPMIWGVGPGNAQSARKNAAWIMGYNEPDLWAPPPVPGAAYLASGTFAPTFHCGSADLARDWQTFVMAFKAMNPSGRVLAPAMADADPRLVASTGEYSMCMASPQSPAMHMPYCPGWLRCFKESVIKLPCGATNCWDVIDALQFHAYAYTAKDVIDKVSAWERLWVDDLTGANGRKKKSLWLTEVARAGAVDSSDPDGKTREFMRDVVGYLKASPYVSGWSWFSADSTTFWSFKIGDVEPATQTWASDLIDSHGQATVIGKYYASLCRGE